MFSKYCRLFRDVADKSRLVVKKIFQDRLGPAFALLRPHYSNMSRFLGFLRVPLGSQFSNFSKVLLRSEFGVPHDSVLGPLLFNIDIINLFYECKDPNVASYADDTTPYSCATDLPSLPLEVQASATKLFRRFKNNHLKANPGKFLYLTWYQ